MERRYRNVGYYLFALPLLMLMGFWVPYFSQLPRFDPDITPAVHVHAWLLFGWVALLIIQPLAVRRGAFATHRALGRLSYWLVPLITVFVIAVIHKEYLEHRARGLSVAASWRGEYLSLLALPLLLGLYGLAIACIGRGDVARHMRYMICTALVVLPAGLGRALGYGLGVEQWQSQAVSFAVIDLSLVALILLDRRHKAPSAPYVVMLLAYLVFEGGWVGLGFPV